PEVADAAARRPGRETLAFDAPVEGLPACIESGPRLLGTAKVRLRIADRRADLEPRRVVGEPRRAPRRVHVAVEQAAASAPRSRRLHEPGRAAHLVVHEPDL